MEAARSCSVCSNTWNHEDHLPVALPACGHSFCRRCLIALYGNDGFIKCPTCRKEYKGVRPDDLPANFALLDFIDLNGQDGAPPASEPEPTDAAPASEAPASEAPASGKLSGVAKGLLYGCGAAVGGVAFVAAAPAVLTAVGFTSAGVAAGSWAASMMSAAAIANGGGVAAGGVIATLQSIGAAGLGATATALVGTAGGAAGAGVAVGAAKLADKVTASEKKEDEPGEGKSKPGEGKSKPSEGKSNSGEEKSKSGEGESKL